ncbi:MAG TPA: lysophospholipid acyltransferase family protein [Phycisphaerae bacterium]|nr:lysophospholipid acyltransferase family protein [Phycisphaerae bacterium]
MNRQRVLHYLTYCALRCIGIPLCMMPLETARRLMRTLGRIWFYLPFVIPESRVPDSLARLGFMRWLVKLSATGNRLLNKFREHRRRAEGHIRRSFPELSPEPVSAIALASMEHLTMLAVEVLRTPREVTPWTWAKYIRLENIDDGLRLLLAKRGCIMLTGHYGNWELLGYTLAVLGFDIVAVMRPLDNEFINHYLLDRRERSGLTLLYKKGATRSAPDVLNSGGALCFIADQNAGRKGLFVDFFGRKASTYKSIGLLAMEYEVPVIVGAACRSGRRFQYEIRLERIIRPEEWKNQADPLLWITSEYTRAIEASVRRAPEQYLWIHRRWKTRPKDEEESANL